MTAAALLRQLAEPALDAYQDTVTVTVPTRLLTALADLAHEASLPLEDNGCRRWYRRVSRSSAEVERAAREAGQ